MSTYSEEMENEARPDGSADGWTNSGPGYNLLTWLHKSKSVSHFANSSVRRLPRSSLYPPPMALVCLVLFRISRFPSFIRPPLSSRRISSLVHNLNTVLFVFCILLHLNDHEKNCFQ